jgi:Cd2+/Zn2+-exporting ATPase/Cu+-exporting ATPase
VIRQNLGFTALYNVIGIVLAFLGLLPPVWAAAAQSIPDVAIMLNSARLFGRRDRPPDDAAKGVTGGCACSCSDGCACTAA